MTGWIVQIRIDDGNGEHVTRWAVAHADWTKAQQIAAEAQGVDHSRKPPHVRVVTIRVRREALRGELEALAPGAARQVQ